MNAPTWAAGASEYARVIVICAAVAAAPAAISSPRPFTSGVTQLAAAGPAEITVENRAK